MSASSSLSSVCRHVRDRLGTARLAELHRENVWLDVLAPLTALGTFLLLVALIASRPGWLVLGLSFVAQGFVAQLMGLVSHDVFVHRRAWGDLGSWLMSLALTVPRLSLPSGYERAHLTHHDRIGTADDPERYKQDLDTAHRRWLFATIFGVRAVQAGKWAREPRAVPQHYRSVETARAQVRRRARMERNVLRLFLLALLALAPFYPRAVLLGYLLPVLVMGPVANTLRVILEHAEADPDNPYWLGTCYRTGPISRPLFLWDSGDCHIVHHLFPRIPFYRMGRAVDAITPVLLERGVVARHSIPELLWGWFVRGYAHRSRWPSSEAQRVS